MASRTDASEAAVDELKRRGRRRLVGAIVLALAAAVVLPMLLESDPKPFGEDVSIKIPPIDTGKFVNPLSPDKGSDYRSTAPATKGSIAAPGAADSSSDASRQRLERNASGSAPAAASTSDSGTSPPATSAPDASAKDTSSTVSPAVPAPATSTATTTASKAAASSSGVYVVQIGAFSDGQAAGEIAAKLKRRGFPAYTEAADTGQGSVQRVRVGPYGSHEAANVALAQIKAAGYRTAIVSAR